MSEAGRILGHFLGRVGCFELDVDLDMPARGVTALTGPSGAGKSSLLRCIAGLNRMAGRLSVEGEIWQEGRIFLPPHRRPVGMVFQDAGLLPHLSVAGNLIYALRRAAGAPKTSFDEVVALFDLSGLLRRSVVALSGGERQRVALARALLCQPRLLLLDEPLSSLDGEAKAEILDYLDRLHASLAAPILYVSHDLDEVSRLADHVLVMRAGRIVEAAADVRVAARSAAELRLASTTPQEARRLALAAILAGLDPA